MSYELVDLQGDQGRVRITLVQEAPEQEFVSPDMPAGATAELEKLTSKGQARPKVKLKVMLKPQGS